jgi:hypothetical protein
MDLLEFEVETYAGNFDVAMQQSPMALPLGIFE